MYLTGKEVLHAQYLIGKIIRFGISFHFNEIGKLNLMLNLCSVISLNFNNEFSLTCILKEISLLAKELGEIVFSKKDYILECVLSCLKHKHEHVQYSSTLAIRSMAESLPFQTSNLIGALLGLVQIDYAELQMSTDKNYLEKYSKSLFGHSIALSSLISTSLEQEFSESNDLSSACLDTALLILSSTSSLKSLTDFPFVMMKKLESCWIIISSLMSLSEDWINIHIEKIFDSWDKMFNSKVGGLLKS
jgi:hypothetical protein